MADKVASVDYLLEQAQQGIDEISRDDRTELMDKLLEAVSDSIFDARQWLSKVDVSVFDYKRPSEHIRLQRPRIKKQP